MRDSIHEVLDLIIDCAAVDLDFRPEDIESILQEAGLMIVPIEDPTNLFGVMEDSE